MASFRKFEEIEAWKLARQLTREIYEISSRPPLARDFSLRDQLRRSAVSVMSNISEGYERDGRREFLQFLSMAKGSLGELRSQLYVALDTNLVGAAELEHLHVLSRRAAAAISSLMTHLRSTRFAGSKFRARELDNPETLKP